MTLHPAMLVFATNNPHKLSEIRKILAPQGIQVLSLADIGCHDDIPETAPTLEGNALQKARWIHSRYHCDCFADDTGLMVDALGGEPGVHSARYAPGTSHDSQANMRLLLDRLNGHADRRAHFSTVIALIAGGSETLFEGRVDGIITTAPAGTNGFGYDPVFSPDEAPGRTFAQMTDDEKNAISHRARASAKLINHLLLNRK